MNDLKVIVFPTKDLQKSKDQFSTLLGTRPYADAAYYVGFRAGGEEIGLDPNAASSGPIPYWEAADINARISELTAHGWQVVRQPYDVGGGMLVAQLKDAYGNTIGLRQNPK